jgi:hypothetical protein
MTIERISDHSLLAYYDGIRRLAHEDRAHPRRFTDSRSIRDRADKLHQKLSNRKLQHSPINWPIQQQPNAEPISTHSLPRSQGHRDLRR